MSAPIITKFPKADQVTIVEEQRFPNGDRIVLQTYKYRNKPVYYIRLWISPSDRGQDLMTQIEYQDLTS